MSKLNETEQRHVIRNQALTRLSRLQQFTQVYDGLRDELKPKAMQRAARLIREISSHLLDCLTEYEPDQILHLSFEVPEGVDLMEWGGKFAPWLDRLADECKTPPVLVLLHPDISDDLPQGELDGIEFAVFTAFPSSRIIWSDPPALCPSCTRKGFEVIEGGKA